MMFKLFWESFCEATLWERIQFLGLVFGLCISLCKMCQKDMEE